MALVSFQSNKIQTTPVKRNNRDEKAQHIVPPPLGQDLFVKSKNFERVFCPPTQSRAVQIGELLSKLTEKDLYTTQHSIEVAAYAVDFAGKLNLSSKETKELQDAALLHDIGKICIPKTILQKPQKLTQNERAIIEQHIQDGEFILEDYPDLQNLQPIIHAHHENWDGTGYPDRKRGNEIPLAARIIAIADTYQAMQGRAYQEPLTLEESCSVLRAGAGKQWDPDLVEKFISMIREKAH